MKKLFCLLLSFTFVFCIITTFGCQKNELLSHVSELRSEIYLGEVLKSNDNGDSKDNGANSSSGEKITIKCAYGFIEQPYLLDGKTGNTINRLKFKLVGDLDSNVSYSVSFLHDGFNYKKEFVYSPENNSYTVCFEINDFSVKEFNASLFIGAKSYPTVLKSIVPSDILSCEKALDKLKENQPSLIKDKTAEDGTFNAEIYMRILVKNDYPYYYVGISHENKIKAMLMDAKTGKILAVKDVF